MIFKKITKNLLLLLAVLGLNLWSFAQPPGGPPSTGGGGSAGSDPPCWQPECIPIDGGLIFLLAAGVLLGVFMLYRRKNVA